MTPPTLPPVLVPEPDAARSLVARLTEDLTRDLTRTWERIVAEQARLLQRWPSGTATARQRRLIELERLVRTLMGDARDVLTVQVPALIAQAGAAGRAGALADMSEVLAAARIDPAVALRFAGDEVSDLLAATTHVEDTTKALVRRLARDHIGDRLLAGQTAQQAGKALERELADAGITAVTYKDGSRHGLAEYSQMVLRTRTAEVFQQAAHATMAANGIEFVEILDNPSCGLRSHDDPQKANGLVMRLADAAQYPLSHPNCVRTTIPRVDVTADDVPDSGRFAPALLPSTTLAQRYDQAAVEAEREAKVARRAARAARALENPDEVAAARHESLARQLEARAARDYRGSLDLRTGAVTSAAELAHIARLEKRAGTEAVSAAAQRFANRVGAGLQPGQPDPA